LAGRRTWRGRGFEFTLNGMSHGAAGYAYALAALSAITGREDFAHAAEECIAFENASYDEARNNWPDLHLGAEAAWPTTQWCHGGLGIGLARLAMIKRGGRPRERLTADARNALAGMERGWPGPVDTLCCGTLGCVEFLCEAADALERCELRELAARRLMQVVETASAKGDYRWNAGPRRYNLGLFRGLAGTGYTCLRQVDPALPNVLLWE
jgi:lantibiotic modifying enzyme